MEQIGEKDRFFKANKLEQISFIERPDAIPPLGLNERIYAGINKGNGEVMYLLEPGQEALAEVRQLWDFWKAGNCESIKFYKA